MKALKAVALYESVGGAISRQRLKRKPKMSQQALAAAVGISRASIANIEQGRHRVQLHVLYEIAAALDLEPHDLLPHLSGDQLVRDLPEDISKKLKSPKEISAVSRLVARGKGDDHE